MTTPVFKANETDKFKDYRPLSVLTSVKVLQILVYKNWVNLLTKKWYQNGDVNGLKVEMGTRSASTKVKSDEKFANVYTFKFTETNDW